MTTSATDGTDGLVITVTRSKGYSRGRPAHWDYTYTVGSDPMICQYGPGLVSLRSRLKFRFPTATIIYTWKA